MFVGLEVVFKWSHDLGLDINSKFGLKFWDFAFRSDLDTIKSDNKYNENFFPGAFCWDTNCKNDSFLGRKLSKNPIDWQNWS